MKLLIVLAAAVALCAARPSVPVETIKALPYLGGAYPYLGGSYPYLGGAYPYVSGSYPYLGTPFSSFPLPLVAPEPVKDTPEVKAVVEDKPVEPVVKAVEEPAPVEPVPAPLVAPEPVQDTPEVAAARAEHLAAVEKAAAAAAAAPEVPVVPELSVVHPGYLYSGLPVPSAFSYSTVAHSPIAPILTPHGRLVTL